VHIKKRWEKIDSYGIEARTAIMDNKDDLKHKDLIVLNVMSVNWDGEVS
jgi:hypothetical protein